MNGKAGKLFLLAATFLLAGLANPAAAAQDEEYYAIFMADVKIGYGHHIRQQTAQEVSNTTLFNFSLSRGETAVQMQAETTTVETPDGKPLRFSSSMMLGGLGGTKKTGVVTNGQIELSTEQMGQVSKQVLPFPKDALMPEGVTLLEKRMGLKPGTTYSYVEFDPDSAGGSKNTVTIESPKSTPLIGHIERLIPVRDEVSLTGQSFSLMVLVDQKLRSKKFEIPLLGTKLSVIACDQAYALSPNGQFDVLGVGTVESPKAIADSSTVKNATYQLAPVNAQDQLEIPATDSQSATRNADGTWTLHVAMLSPPKAARPYKGGDPAALEALKPSQYVQCDNATIQAKSRVVVGSETDAYAAAKKIEKWVGGYIRTKDLSVGYASALETLQSRTGDCTEHAVLTAALCRAAGIPCRIVNGVAYADHFAGQTQRFVGHEWNQVFIDGKWVDIDAALGADAARIQLATGGDDPTSFIGILKNLGNFKITSIETK